jgi:hypothetical protein
MSVGFNPAPRNARRRATHRVDARETRLGCYACPHSKKSAGNGNRLKPVDILKHSAHAAANQARALLR